MAVEEKEKPKYAENSLEFWYNTKIKSFNIRLRARKAILNRYGSDIYKTHKVAKLSEAMHIITGISEDTVEGKAFWRELEKQSGLAEKTNGILEVRFKDYEQYCEKQAA